MLYSLPYNDTNPDVRANFYKNKFSVTRQVHYSDCNPNLSIDMVVFLNGLAIATLELKNAWSGQTVYHAKKQYREDRDPKESEDVQDKILNYMEGRKLGRNASYFAFTATPKNATLEKFGRQTANLFPSICIR